jgi:hypothetical protein
LWYIDIHGDKSMLNLSRLLKMFRRDNLLAALQPDMNETELSEASRKLAEKLVRFIHEHAIGFYRSIGSHDFGAYPGVWEEFFFLILFASEIRLKSNFGSACADSFINILKRDLDSFLVKHEKDFVSQPFWELYEQRAGLYKRREQHDGERLCFDNVISAFSANIISRLDDWPALVSHHSSTAAAAAISELYGD